MTWAPLRIIHCVRSPIGGIFRHICDLAAAQSDAGHAVGIVFDSSTGGRFDLARLDSLSDKLTLGIGRFPMRRHLGIQDAKAAGALYRHVRNINPDILHGHGAKGGAYARTIGTLLRMKGRNVTRVYTPHGGSLHYDPHRLEGYVYHRLERILERMSDAIVFVSDYEAAAYQSKVGTPNIAYRVVYNGLRPEEFSPLGDVEDAADFVFVGMLRDLKGPDLFIEGLYNTKLKTGRTPTARIFGEGPDEARYRALVETYGLSDKVTFMGASPARTAMAAGRTLVVPSRAEAMPYIVLEAVAAERPLIATRVGGIPEIFGKHARRLIDPGNVAQLTAAMVAALDNPARMADEARTLRKCLSETYTVDLMHDRITSLYRTVRGEQAADPLAPGNMASIRQAEAARPAYVGSGQKE
ncbi:transferase [Roseibium aquae]|uniref:Transferase n=1 Tax=Roseibium aquae TaxID=1323746 RepID=A0A916X1A8_9HYPH|nr:glycosyltransferase family 4 protein [Roseibium aquae]GGB54930.1 transferase [Roseibium aquae]